MLFNSSSYTKKMKVLMDQIFDSPPLFLFFVSLLSLFLLYTFTFTKRNHRNLPPHPPKLPLLGNLLQIGSLLHQSLYSLSLKHGPLMFVYLGQRPYLVISSSDMAEVVLRTYDLAFANHASSLASDILGATDVGFEPYGDIWRQMRKICSIHLLSSKKVHSYERIKEEEIGCMIEEIKQQASQTNGVALDMSKILYFFANNIVCRVVSGKFSKEEGRNGLFRELIEGNVTLFGAFSVCDLFPSLSWLDGILGLRGRMKKHRNRWDKLLDEVIQIHIQEREREKEGGESANFDGHEDFVDVLLSLHKDSEKGSHLSMEYIRGLLLDVFAAGTDTTYIALEWALSELIKNPSTMKKLKDEVRRVAKHSTTVTAAEVTQMHYIQAVTKETLRLHPPAPLLLPRQSREECNLNGYTIPKGTRVFINFWAIGREPKSWETPNKFKPERFIGSEVDYKGSHFQFIPFGAGRRICPGMNFAASTVELALANLIHQFDWELPNGVATEKLDMEEAPGLSTRRKENLQLVAKYGASVTENMLDTQG